MVNGSNVTTKSTWVIISEQPMVWSTENVDTAIPNYSNDALKTDMNGQEHTQTLLALGADKYPAAAWAAQQFNGLGYLPSAGELYKFGTVIRDFGFNSIHSQRKLWSSNETYSRYGYDKEAALLGSGNVSTTTALKSSSNYVLAFCKLSGPCSIPIYNNGHDYVDLGLPSGTLWATMNVGASSTTEYGDYYMYGMGSKTFDNTDTPYAGTERPLDLTKDTAKVVWGGNWHMPTKNQQQELIDNTTYMWTTNYNNSGINGGLYTAQNGNSIFFPAAGSYNQNGKLEYEGFGSWTYGSHPNTSTRAYIIYATESGTNTGMSYRYNGLQVRPVIG